jgi:glycosyltransferase involved in cell wall biosynthesis
VVVSELRRQELVDLMKLDHTSVRVIPNGVDATRFYKFESQTKNFLDRTQIMDAVPLLLLPVRITRRKNIELALHTLAELHKYFPRAALLVTGPLGPHSSRSHEYFNVLLDLRAQLGLQDSAFFLAELLDSFLPDDVIADFFRIADALLFPSREEGFGIPLIEAAFSHLPVFCADIPPLHELGLDDVYYFQADEEPTVIADAIAEYFQTTAPARLALRARTTFRWEVIYQQHIAPLLSKE